MADEIIEGLYLGDYDDAHESVAGEFSRIFNVLCWIEPDYDTGFVDEKALDALAYLIHSGLDKAMEILVHCRAGMERSPLVVAWYLYNYHSDKYPTLGDAYGRIRECRPMVQNRECWIKNKRRK